MIENLMQEWIGAKDMESEMFDSCEKFEKCWISNFLPFDISFTTKKSIIKSDCNHKNDNHHWTRCLNTVTEYEEWSNDCDRTRRFMQKAISIQSFSDRLPPASAEIPKMISGIIVMTSMLVQTRKRGENKINSNNEMNGGRKFHLCTLYNIFFIKMAKKVDMMRVVVFPTEIRMPSIPTTKNNTANCRKSYARLDICKRYGKWKVRCICDIQTYTTCQIFRNRACLRPSNTIASKLTTWMQENEMDWKFKAIGKW